MNFYNRKKLIDIEVDDEVHLIGKLKATGHYIRFRKNPDDTDDCQSFILQFGNYKTFDRWGNSTDIEITILKRGFKDTQNSIIKAIEFAEDMFKRIVTISF